MAGVTRRQVLAGALALGLTGATRWGAASARAAAAVGWEPASREPDSSAGPGGPSSPRLVVPAYWAASGGAVDRLLAARPPAGFILCGGAGTANHLPWYDGQDGPHGEGEGRRQIRQQRESDVIAAVHAAGGKLLNYIGIGELQGGYPASSGGAIYSDLNAILGKIAQALQLYPELDGIFLDEGPYRGYQRELAAIRDLIRSYEGKLIVMNVAGWQGNADPDRVQYADIINVFESGWDSDDGNGPWFGHAEGDNGYTQPDWFHREAASSICAWVYGVPDSEAAIDLALATARGQGLGNLYLTDQQSHPVWGGPPSDSFMATLFARLRAA